MQLNDFLVQFVEQYLFADLATMADAKPPTQAGHLGYPMLMSCAGGIEMLGILAKPSLPFQPLKSGDNFVRYWSTYLYPSGPRRDVGEAVYKLVRHGIAHNFAAKMPFAVTKGGVDHLFRDATGFAVVDALRLFEDFRESYFNKFKPVATGQSAIGPSGESAASMQICLGEVELYNGKFIPPCALALAALPATTYVVVGASGALGPPDVPVSASLGAPAVAFSSSIFGKAIV